MIQKYMQDIIHKCILETWNDIKADYDKCSIPSESSFVSAFYYHLRTRLTAFESDNIRIYTEFSLNFPDKHFRADMAVVKYGEHEFDIDFEDVAAIIEFKLTWYRAGHEKIAGDFEKIEEYMKRPELKNCHFYVVSMNYSNYDEDYFMKKDSKRITEMTAFENKDGEMIFKPIR